MVGEAHEFRSQTAARRTQSLLNQMLAGQALMATSSSEPAAKFLCSKGYLESRGGGIYRVSRTPDRVCRRCYLRSSRQMRTDIRLRPPSPEQLARERARAAARDRVAAKLAAEASWRNAAAELGLDPPAEEFECPECGRWASASQAHEVRARIVGELLKLDSARFGSLMAAARDAPVRPAYLQRTFMYTYEDAVGVLTMASRLGILDERGKGLTPASARCGYCYERRVAALRDSDTQPGTRDPIPKQLRFRVLQRDGFRCVYCGRSPRDGAMLHLDHVVPVAAGGETTEDNLITACDACNLGKSASSVIP